MVEAGPADRELKPSDWTTLGDDKILEIRMCDLGVCASRAPSSRRASRPSTASSRPAASAFRPRYWLSDEWFTPDGVPGVAIPFYLAHPRLEKLELAQMLEVEGGDEATCLKILRHEVGHAIDNAYRTAAAADPAASVRQPRHAVSRVLHAEALQQELRPAPRSLVRAEPSRRGFRGDLRRLARSAVALGDAVTPAGRRSASSSTWIA